jgi:hypothetical protein
MFVLFEYFSRLRQRGPISSIAGGFSSEDGVACGKKIVVTLSYFYRQEDEGGDGMGGCVVGEEDIKEAW